MATSKQTGLTQKQRRTLEEIKIIIEVRRKSMWESITQLYPSGTMFYDGVEKPIILSEWVPLNTLVGAHHVNRGTIRQLVAKGALLYRPSDGAGVEVKPA
jgi:hypothetical protein